MNANDYRVAGTNRFDFPSVAQFARVCNNDPRIKLRDSGSWTGESLAGKRILLHAEQGLGDSIQFMRYVPLVADQAAETVLQLPVPFIWLTMKSWGGVG